IKMRGADTLPLRLRHRLGTSPGETRGQRTAGPCGDPEMALKVSKSGLKQAIDALGGTVVRIVVAFQPDVNTFTADVVVNMPDGSDRHLDWRVSDAIALAVRCDSPPSVLVPEALLAEPPPSLTVPHWPDRVRVRCSCGAWISAGQQLPEADPAADHLEADLDCPSCGERRHFRIERPPTPGPAGH
ncbi:MAG TPA: bifunctional nuclease domain-containing protein, partial [Acidimicrobiales bacterium]|nr:bifunctional nuclease domain-containing protein [Acidimicrobiales bacterium]